MPAATRERTRRQSLEGTPTTRSRTRAQVTRQTISSNRQGPSTSQPSTSNVRPSSRFPNNIAYKKQKKDKKITKPKDPQINIEIPKLTEDDPCPICYSELINEDSYAKIEDCTHLFCIECIRKWSREKSTPTCPMCNKNFTKVYEIKKSGKVVKLDARTLVREGKNSSNTVLQANRSNGYDDFRDYQWEFGQRLGYYRNDMKVKKFSKRFFHKFKKPADFQNNRREVARLDRFICRELMATAVKVQSMRLVSEFTEKWLVKILNSIETHGLPEFKKNRWTTNTELPEMLKEILSPNNKWVHIFIHEITYYAASHCAGLEEFDNHAVYATLDDGERELEEAEKKKGTIVIGLTPDDNKSSKSRSRSGKSSSPIVILDDSFNVTPDENSRKRKESNQGGSRKRVRLDERSSLSANSSDTSLPSSAPDGNNGIIAGLRNFMTRVVSPLTRGVSNTPQLTVSSSMSRLANSRISTNSDVIIIDSIERNSNPNNYNNSILIEGARNNLVNSSSSISIIPVITNIQPVVDVVEEINVIDTTHEDSDLSGQFEIRGLPQSSSQGSVVVLQGMLNRTLDFQEVSDVSQEEILI